MREIRRYRCINFMSLGCIRILKEERLVSKDFDFSDNEYRIIGGKLFTGRPDTPWNSEDVESRDNQSPLVGGICGTCLRDDHRIKHLLPYVAFSSEEGYISNRRALRFLNESVNKLRKAVGMP